MSLTTISGLEAGTGAGGIQGQVHFGECAPILPLQYLDTIQEPVGNTGCPPHRNLYRETALGSTRSKYKVTVRGSSTKTLSG
jgi:hypothetical protein